MPSGHTHDAVTFLLTAPIGAVVWKFTDNIPLVAIVTLAFLFGGLMFGPDLDTHSKQYTRWGIFRNLWYPYQKFFKHRSRWSHGLIFGTLLRVIYFIGVLTLLSFLITFLYCIYLGGDIPHLFEFTKSWQQIGEFIRISFGEYAFYAGFTGLWLGAASHTLADIIGTFLKTGKVGEFL
jgi:uncharacterized metal-binding protein